IVEGEQEACNCGKKGCLEQVASATGIVRVAKRILAAAETESVLRNIDNLTAKDVFDAAQAGDALAVQTAETVCEYLGRGLACVAAVVDPECFLIGGGVSKAGKYFTDLIGKYYQKHAFHPSRGTKIVTAQLGNDAGMYGAAKLAADNIKNGAE
ncbi:MAG: ROK family protein, partial [Lachnospira sp.]